MERRAKRNLILAGGGFVVGITLAIWFLREPTEALTSEVLEAAKERWNATGIRDYDLRYRMHDNLYEVKARNGVVTELKVNGRAARTGDPNAYSVEGLFDTLEQELENVADPAGPLAGGRGTMPMRVRFNAERGHIERYLRGPSGGGRGVTIELIELLLIE